MAKEESFYWNNYGPHIDEYSIDEIVNLADSKKQAKVCFKAIYGSLTTARVDGKKEFVFSYQLEGSGSESVWVTVICPKVKASNNLYYSSMVLGSRVKMEYNHGKILKYERQFDDSLELYIVNNSIEMDITRLGRRLRI